MIGLFLDEALEWEEMGHEYIFNKCLSFQRSQVQWFLLYPSETVHWDFFNDKF